MYADLVRSAGIDFHFEQSEFAEGALEEVDDTIVRDGFAASSAARGHARAMKLVAADGGRDCGMVFLHRSMNEGDVGLLGFAAGGVRGGRGQGADRFLARCSSS